MSTIEVNILLPEEVLSFARLGKEEIREEMRRLLLLELVPGRRRCCAEAQRDKRRHKAPSPRCAKRSPAAPQGRGRTTKERAPPEIASRRLFGSGSALPQIMRKTRIVCGISASRNRICHLERSERSMSPRQDPQTSSRPRN